MTFGSLFAGIGGIDLGLERAGMQCQWQVENDPFCTRVLRKHWPNVKRYSDIRDCGPELERVDVIAGGFPCQDLSQAGKRTGIEGDRSGLWFEFARLIGILGPRVVLIENVPGLLDHRAMPRVIGELARMRYVGCWFRLRAADFGAAHLRKRIFIVAYRESEFGRREYISVSRSALPPGDSSASRELAHAEMRGRGELRESSRFERFFDGLDTSLENAGRAGHGRAAESAGLDRSGSPVHDSGTVRALADAGNGFVSESRRRSERRDGLRPAGPFLSDPSESGLQDPEQEQLPRAFGNKAGRTVTELCGPFAPGPAYRGWPDILRAFPYVAPAVESPSSWNG
jgi:site-specific DNA-cytosine methylase